MQFNAFALEFGMIMLEVRQSDGTPLSLVPPPVPRHDDGEVSRMNLEPTQSVTFFFPGIDLFVKPLTPGAYEVRFRCEKLMKELQAGIEITESDWLTFEVSD
jgi:hypothetical protein